MATGVGLRIADDECIAAIVADTDVPIATATDVPIATATDAAGAADSDDTSAPHYIVRDSVLHMSDDGDAALGGERPSDHSHSITGFFGAVGDPAGISVDDGPAYRAEDLVATALFCLINLAAEHLTGPAEFYATYPADWPEQQVSALRDALDYLGLRSVGLVSEGDLPASADGRDYTRHAARTALTAVLATPAGTTPPDPSNAENSLDVTDVLPTLPANEPTVQAYSEAMPTVYPAAYNPATAYNPTATHDALAPAEDEIVLRGSLADIGDRVEGLGAGGGGVRPVC